MVIALIIVSILALIFLGLAILFARMTSKLCDYIEMINALAELEDGPPPEEMILEKYPNATMLYNLERAAGNEDFAQIYDTSLYLKNGIIGLTQFVQEQVLEEIAAQKKLQAQDVIDIAKNIIIPNCTVYQLKNGMWLWRINENDDV